MRWSFLLQGLIAITIAVSSFADGPTAARDAGLSKNGIQVLEMKICRDIRERSCIDAVETAALNDTVAGYTVVRTGAGEVAVSHRWVANGETVSEVPLTLKGSPFRTWSRKTLATAGDWKLQVVDANGNVLKEIRFKVQP
jgi:hypothetical protein